MPAGQPTKYKGKETDELVYGLSLLGLIDREMAGVLQITEQTFNNWKKEHPKFFESIKRGKDAADVDVVKSLYKRANGYDYEEVKTEQGKSGNFKTEKTTKTTKHIAPDVGAAAFWLKNRRRKDWNDRGNIDDTPDERPVLENGDKLPDDE